MHVLILSLQLRCQSDEEFRAAAVKDAPNFADLPGLISQVWLADPATDTYGGVFIWRNRRAMEGFIALGVLQEVRESPLYQSVTWRDFGVLAEPTAITGGPLAPAVARSWSEGS